MKRERASRYQKYPGSTPVPYVTAAKSSGKLGGRLPVRRAGARGSRDMPNVRKFGIEVIFTALELFQLANCGALRGRESNPLVSNSADNFARHCCRRVARKNCTRFTYAAGYDDCVQFLILICCGYFYNF
ncbi:hypothetical protein ACJJTC_005437 [Scirpophaga incertulas]